MRSYHRGRAECAREYGKLVQLIRETDNGPAYTSQKFALFCQLWGIRHITGIPHSPTGQAIVERAHQTLKVLLQKQNGGEVLAAAEPFAKAVYVLKYLRLTGDREEPPVIIHKYGSEIWYKPVWR